MDKKDIFIPCTISSLLFIINPVSGILFLIAVTPLIYNKDNLFFTLFLLMSLFLGLINTTKSFEEGDLGAYLIYFETATRLDLLSFLKTTIQEPAYYTFMFFINRVSGANFKFFIIFTTALAYFFYFVSIYKINKRLSRNKSSQLFTFLIASLFFTLFSLSAHLMRQFLATSIFLYFLVNRLFYKRNYWWLLIIAILCHTSVALFLPLIFIKSLGEKIKIQNILKIAFLPIFVVIVFLYFNSLFASIGGPFNYIANRVSENSFDDGNSTALITIIFTVILLLLSIITIYFKRGNSSGWIYFNHLVIITCLVVLITVSSYPLISYRYGFYLYFFFPIIFSGFIIKRYFRDLTFVIQTILVFSMTFFFGYMINNGPFSYLGLNEILTKSLFSYFI